MSSYLMPVVPKDFHKPHKPLSSVIKEPVLDKVKINYPNRNRNSCRQDEILNDFFYKESQRPTKEDYENLVVKTKRSENFLRNWFCSKRFKIKNKGKSKKMNDSQLKTLEMFFEQNQVPSNKEILKLSNDLSISFLETYKWFNKNRTRTKNQLKHSKLSGADKKDKVRRKATIFTCYDAAVLKMEYKKCAYPNLEDKLRISVDLGVDVKAVINWFNHHRQKIKASSTSKTTNNYPESTINDCDPSTSSKLGEETTLSTLPSELDSQAEGQNNTNLVKVCRTNSEVDPLSGQYNNTRENNQSAKFFGLESINYESQDNYTDTLNINNEASACESLNIETLNDKNKRYTYNEPTQGKINLQDDHLSEYNEDSDLEDLIGDTSLFPEIFSDTNCTLFGKGYEFL